MHLSDLQPITLQSSLQCQEQSFEREPISIFKDAELNICARNLSDNNLGTMCEALYL